MGNFSDNSKDTATAYSYILLSETAPLWTLGTRDATADDFRDCFDYTQPPTPIPTAHTAAFFLHQKGSGPPDTDERPRNPPRTHAPSLNGSLTIPPRHAMASSALPWKVVCGSAMTVWKSC